MAIIVPTHLRPFASLRVKHRQLPQLPQRHAVTATTSSVIVPPKITRGDGAHQSGGDAGLECADLVR